MLLNFRFKWVTWDISEGSSGAMAAILKRSSRVLACYGSSSTILTRNAPVLRLCLKLTADSAPARPFSAKSNALYSAGRRYSEKHEWVEVNGTIGTVGITDYAQNALGEIVYAQLPDIGTELKAMDECGALESVKAASELYCPVSGQVVEKNNSVEDTPGFINSSCYDKGWLFKLELSNINELDSLLDDEGYKKYLKSMEE